MKASATALRICLVLCLCSIAGPAAEAEPGTRISGITLDDAFRSALARSESVAIQEEAIVQAEERYSQARGALFPSVTASYLFVQQTDPGTALASQFSPATQNTVKLNATQPLFRGLRDFAALRLRRTQADAQVNARDQARRQLYLDVAGAFYNVFLLEGDLKLLSNQEELNRRRLADIKAGNASGRFREAEVLAVSSSLANIEAQFESTQGQLATARELFAFQTGLERDVALKDDLDVPENPRPVESLLGRISSRPDILSARRELEASEDQVSIARGAHLPSLDLSANYYPVRPGLLSNISWDVSLQAVLPIFSGGATQSAVRESASVRKSRELSLARALRQAEQELRSLHATVVAARAQVCKLEAAVQFTERNSLLEERDFRSGRANSVEVLQAMDTALQTYRSYDRARYVEKLDLIRLEVAAAIRPAPAAVGGSEVKK